MTPEDYRRHVKRGQDARDCLFQLPPSGTSIDFHELGRTAAGWASTAVTGMHDVEAAMIGFAGLAGQLKELDDHLAKIEAIPLPEKVDERHVVELFRLELRGIAEGIKALHALAERALMERSFGRLAFLLFQAATSASLFFGHTERWTAVVGRALDEIRKAHPRRSKGSTVAAGDAWKVVQVEWETRRKSGRRLPLKKAMEIFEKAGGNRNRSPNSFKTELFSRRRRWAEKG